MLQEHVDNSAQFTGKAEPLVDMGIVWKHTLDLLLISQLVALPLSIRIWHSHNVTFCQSILWSNIILTAIIYIFDFLLCYCISLRVEEYTVGVIDHPLL